MRNGARFRLYGGAGESLVAKADTQISSISPKIYTVLSTLPKDALHYSSHQLRHPAAIYLQSLDRIFKALEQVLNQVELYDIAHLNADGKMDFESKELLLAQTEVLGAIFSHFDDCYSVLKACFPMPKHNVNQKFTDKWLEKAGHPTIKSFKNNINAYREFVGNVYNNVKHNQGRLRDVIFVSELPNQPRIAGYFLEGVHSDKSIGPHPQVHPNCTAFSFNRNLKYHLIHLYIIARHLHSAVLGALPKPKIEVASYDTKEYSGKTLESVIQRIASRPMIFFPDEIQQSVPWITYDNQSRLVKTTFPSLNRARMLQGKYMIGACFVGDGFSSTFKLPYFISASK